MVRHDDDDNVYQRVPAEETGLVITFGMLANLLVVLVVGSVLGIGAGITASGLTAVAIALYSLRRRSMRYRP